MPSSLFQQPTSGQNQPNPINGQIQSIKRMAGMLKGKTNPMQILQMAAGQNPQVAQIMNMVGNSNLSPKQMFYNMAQQYGIDPSAIIDMLK